MKLTGRDANRYFAMPDPARCGLLIYGEDAMRVALKRQQVIAALIGPQGEAEMRLTRIQGGDLRRDGALLHDAVKAVGFFPGPRAAFVEEATDGLTDTIAAALSDWRPGDAAIIVTAGQLPAKSKLRAAFEKHPNAYAVGIYDEPPGRDEIEADLKRAGIAAVSPEAMTDLVALSRLIDPGDFRQTTEKLGLYKLGDPTPVSPADVAACAPTSTEAALDDLLTIVADGRTAALGPVMQRLATQGTQAVGICIGATRHFRMLYAVASDPGGAAQGIGRLRPPVFGPRRDLIQQQAQAWGAARLQDALTILIDTDLTLRSAGQTAPALALVERALLRLSEMIRRK